MPAYAAFVPLPASEAEPIYKRTARSVPKPVGRQTRLQKWEGVYSGTDIVSKNPKF